MAQLNTHVDVQSATLTRERDQRRTVLLEAASLADTETLTYQRPEEQAPGEEAAVPHTSVAVYTHDGGLENGTAAATYVTSDGDTIILEFWDPDNDAHESPSAHDYYSPDNPRKYTRVTHVLSGVTAGAATPAQIVASLMADENFTRWAYAAASIATANAVTLFPRGPRGRVRCVGGTSVLASRFPGVEADNAQRTFTRVDHVAAVTDPWDVSYDAGTRTLTITNNTAATVERVTAVVSLF